MSNIFDDLKGDVFNIITEVFGYNARRLPFNTLVGVTFANPTNKERKDLELDGFKYGPENIIMSYLLPNFPGLYEAVRMNEPEFIEIEGVTYECQDAIKMFDGDTVYIKLLKYESV